jgi:hypothetical protein
MDSVYLSSPMFSPDAQLSNYFGLRTYSNPQLVPHAQGTSALDDVDSSGSENASGVFSVKRGQSHVNESPLQSFASELATDLRSHVVAGSVASGEQKVVGTPDYLAPETILAISKDDRMVDWVSDKHCYVLLPNRVNSGRWVSLHTNSSSVSRHSTQIHQIKSSKIFSLGKLNGTTNTSTRAKLLETLSRGC